MRQSARYWSTAVESFMCRHPLHREMTPEGRGRWVATIPTDVPGAVKPRAPASGSRGAWGSPRASDLVDRIGASLDGVLLHRPVARLASEGTSDRRADPIGFEPRLHGPVHLVVVLLGRVQALPRL